MFEGYVCKAFVLHVDFAVWKVALENISLKGKFISGVMHEKNNLIVIDGNETPGAAEYFLPGRAAFSLELLVSIPYDERTL